MAVASGSGRGIVSGCRLAQRIFQPASQPPISRISTSKSVKFTNVLSAELLCYCRPTRPVGGQESGEKGEPSGSLNHVQGHQKVHQSDFLLFDRLVGYQEGRQIKFGIELSQNNL